ncbi:hypothetical protein Z517_07920 [Fonsecaea pedrosoi CBS 271.37]|uniref:Uncharacterized protein n=1 Tax=Fonsecaea pedrosoi CBS 271.37 TaxID=1442368 RepID=A0A0D2EV34_9EURO|nr:uncharacterized protein Z517_07920 [Fonsecaea pedrosoi CBS 271.37]KIW78087.1 hypothetical protein Z517_07920 [Fonsecaea pedrosoi CBS 271.37]
MSALFQRDETAVGVLLDTGKVDLDRRDGYGYMPLMLAAVKRALLKTGKVNPDDRNGVPSPVSDSQSAIRAIVNF